MRIIDADALLKKLQRMIDYCKNDNQVNGLTALFQVGDAIMDCPTFIPPNEPMLERVVREYLEICGNDCAGDPSVGIPECPFYWYADILDNGALIQPKCELAAYRNPPEGEEDT